MNLNKFKNLDLKTRTKILILLYALLTASTVYFYILPSILEIELSKQDILTEKVEQEKTINRGKNYANLGSKLKEVEPQLGVLENIYINANRKLEFITTLEGAAIDSGVEQKLNLDLKFNSDGNVKEVPLVIEINGSYASVMNYLIAIETIPYYINVNSFDLTLFSQTKEGVNFDNYSLRLTANTYWK